jgi:hypothetical protein
MVVQGRSLSYLAKSHGDSAIFRACRKTGGCTSTLSSCNTSLRRTVALCATAAQEASEPSSASITTLASTSTEESAKELTLLLALLLDVVLNADTA